MLRGNCCNVLHGLNMNTDWLPIDLNNIPTESGVYAFIKEDEWLYIGKAENLKRRRGIRIIGAENRVKRYYINNTEVFVTEV